MKVEYYNGHLCISRDELIGGATPLVKEGTLNSWITRKIVRQSRKAFGYGVTALIEYNSLPKSVREAFEKRYGDPKLLAIQQEEQESGYVEDAFARNFYESHTYDKNGKTVRLKEKYINQYTIDASVLNSLVDRWAVLQATTNKLNNNRKDFWKVLLDFSEALRYDYGHKLPASEGGLRRKLTAYRKEGYVSLISKKFGNQNTVKITEEAGLFLIALKRNMDYRRNNSQIFEEYNRVAPDMGWKPLDSLQSLTAFLNDPATKQKWLATESGETLANKELTRLQRTIMPTRRNSVWEGDGTRLNLYFRGEDGSRTTTDVYYVMDVTTRMIIGWSYGKGETFEMIRKAFRMALERSGERPYQIKTDNQGSAKSGRGQEFIESIALMRSNSAVYRSSSKLIESVIGDLQRIELRKYPNFTGTNVTARTGRPNIDWLNANKDDYLPSYGEMIAQHEEAVRRWNETIVTRDGKSRQQLYAELVNDELPAVTKMDYIRIFWELHPYTNTYTQSGITITRDGKEITYEVLDDRHLPDVEWLLENTGRQFQVKYDPDDMTQACLFSIDPDGELRFDRELSPYLQVVRAAQDQTADDARYAQILVQMDKQMRMEREARGRAIDYLYGRTYVQPRVAGLSTAENERVEERARELEEEYRGRVKVAKSEKRPVKKVDIPKVVLMEEAPEEIIQKAQPMSLGQVMKAESKMDYEDPWLAHQNADNRKERISKY